MDIPIWPPSPGLARKTAKQEYTHRVDADAISDRRGLGVCHDLITPSNDSTTSSQARVTSSSNN
jgi:hypothetical protein